VRGVWRPPGDKSITHRAVILGLLAHGTTEIEGFLESDDCLRTLQMAQQLGAQAERVGAAHWRIVGTRRAAPARACSTRSTRAIQARRRV
jgi:3-phosphoshikimate 1-carboxyvinyltransferase